MNSICIVTDNSAQFYNSSFPGWKNTKIIPLEIELNHRHLDKNAGLRSRDLPKYANEETSPRLLPPTVEDFRQLFTNLAASYNEILGIFMSSQLSTCFQNAQEAAVSLHSGPKIQLIDSLTTSFGLGYLVQLAAESVTQGASIIDIERSLRNVMQGTYSVFCIPGLSYLYSNGFLDFAQASVSEMLGIYPIFSIEDGRINPVEKVRNKRNAVVYFQEFLDEFDSLKHIALIQSAPPSSQETRILREHVREKFPDSIFSEHLISLPLSALFGPQSLGIFVIE